MVPIHARYRAVVIALVLLISPVILIAAPRQASGIYPSLTMFNNEGECGTGAVVVFADRLWAITYAPHMPHGSSDKLYEITPELMQIIRPESVGGTPANRMIHRETNQLVIGPYIIDAQRNVRVLSPKLMPGRLTGNARHLTDPASKIYYATMEEGLYEVDLKTFEITGLIKDGNGDKAGSTQQKNPAKIASKLPGYHGKGLYCAQGQLIYANNGEHGGAALKEPTTPSGALASWQGEGDWQLVRRNQFTEVTGPGGIYGNDSPATDPLWSIGWDARSLILMLLDAGKWHAYRLPKASHSYDGAHGWNTEWPRIRDIGEGDLLMTMHGTMWRFPRAFSANNSAGISPRSTYIKVIGDFTRWNDRIVFGCDDTAKSEFLNKRKAKGNLTGPGQSQSNLWFVEPAKLDHIGPPLGRGALWLNDDVEAGAISDPYLFTGYAHRSLHLSHESATPIALTLEIDAKGDGQWKELRTITVPAKGYTWTAFSENETGTWIRMKASEKASKLTAFFHYRGTDTREAKADAIFDGLAKPGDTNITGGTIHARGGNFRTLRFVATNPTGDVGCYDLDADLNLKKVDDAAGMQWTRSNTAIPSGVLTIDDASVLYVDGNARWRLPKGDAAFDKPGALGDERVCREVCTERDLFSAHGTFYELPADNAGGFAKVRPVTTHNRRIKDYTSYRGLLVMTGIVDSAKASEHIVRSDDGKCALWVGAVDDLWKLGKPRGIGGPWKNTAVKAGAASDPYLMTGYDRKRLTLSHTSREAVKIRVEVDVTGNGIWSTYETIEVAAGKATEHVFPDAFSAYWIRVVSAKDTTATAQFIYE